MGSLFYRAVCTTCGNPPLSDEIPLPRNYHPHGFSRPFSVQQYETWALLATQFILFYTLALPFLPRPALYFHAGAHVVWVIIGFCVFISLSFSDPVHENVALAREKAHKASQTPGDNPFQRVEPVGENNGISAHCVQCNINREKTTKHCTICRKCVREFDHHCLFLNTCIGKRNYRRFFTIVSMVNVITIYQLVIVGYLFFNYNEPALEARIASSIFSGTSLAYYIVLGVSAAAPLGTLFGFGTLWAFHAYISVRGISTYEWILARRRVKAERQEVKRQAEMRERQTDLDQKRQQIYHDWMKERKRKNEEKARGSSVRSARHSGLMTKTMEPYALNASGASIAKDTDVTASEDYSSSICVVTDDSRKLTNGATANTSYSRSLSRISVDARNRAESGSGIGSGVSVAIGRDDHENSSTIVGDTADHEQRQLLAKDDAPHAATDGGKTRVPDPSSRAAELSTGNNSDSLRELKSDIP